MIVQLNANYKTTMAGEFVEAQSADEYEYLIAKSKIGVQDPKTNKGTFVTIGKPAALCKVLKLMTHADVQSVLNALPHHLMKKPEYDAGDHIALVSEHAEKLAKAGFVESLTKITARKDDVETSGGAMEKGQEKHVPASEAAALEKAGKVKIARKGE